MIIFYNATFVDQNSTLVDQNSTLVDSNMASNLTYFSKKTHFSNVEVKSYLNVVEMR